MKNSQALDKPKTSPKPALSQSQGDNNLWWQDSVILFARLSSWIGLPIILAALLGHWLDEKFKTAPWLFLATIALAFVISLFGLVAETSKAYRRIIKDSESVNKSQPTKPAANKTGNKNSFPSQ